MLEGIEVLSQSEVGINPEPIWWLSAIIGGVVLLIFVILGITGWVCCDGDYIDFIVATLVGLFLGSLTFAGFLSVTSNVNYTDTQTQYKVTISDEVNLNEFNEQYEIIEQEGKIYTIVEKE